MAAMFDWQVELSRPAPPVSFAPPVFIAARAVSTPSIAAPPVSFAQAFTGSTKSTSNDNLPHPLVRGEQVSIKITQDVYEKGTTVCKHNLRGQLLLNKGDKPYTKKDIQTQLLKVWKTTATWSMTSLGRGYYEFFFANENDKRNVWAAGTVNLKPGVLRLFEWTKDFNMHNQRNTHAQVWIRLMELPQEYWMERTLREIANAAGTPLLIDNAVGIMLEFL